jgi:hypothetical protein
VPDIHARVSDPRVRSPLLLLALLVLSLAAAGLPEVIIISFLTDDDPSHRQQSASCTEAMSYADQDGLPPGAYDATCHVEVWLDTEYDVRFRISRADLNSWLASAYPDTTLGSDYCYPDTIDACADIQLDPPAKGGAVAINVTVEWDGPTAAVVHFQPFDV